MGYYKPPKVYLFTLTLTTLLKLFFLQEYESYLKDENLSLSQTLFMTFIISGGLSLGLLWLMTGGKKGKGYWSFKLVAVIGGRENSPKLGPGLFAGSIYIVRVGGLMVGSLLTSPFRAVMISEYITLCLSSSRSGVSNLERRFQRFLVRLLPIVACLLFDYRSMAGAQLDYINDEIVPKLGIFSTQPDLKVHHPFETLVFGYFGIIASSIAQRLLGWVFEPSISSSLTTTAIGRRAVTNQILFFSLVQGMAAVLVIPWLTSVTIVPMGFGTLFLYLGIWFTLNLCGVMNFRISKLLPAHQDLPWINWLVSIIGAMIYCLFCTQAPEDPKSLFSFSDLLLIFLVLVTLFLTRPDPLDKSSSKPTGLLSGIKRRSNLGENLGHFLAAILASQDSKQIFYFMLLNLSYMFVQLAYGFWTNSLGLISDAIHMFFDCVALGVGLFAAVTSKWPKNHQFSYGYSRVEVLSGFSNGIFLALISIFIVLEAVGRLINPPEMNTDRLLLVSFLGLVVNLVGILAFNHGHHHGHCHSHSEPSSHVHIDDHQHHDHHSHDHALHDHAHHDHKHDHKHHDHHSHDHEHAHHDHNHSHGHTDIHVHQSNGNHDHGHGHSHNMEGVFLHIMADTLGSVGVIISTLLIKYFGWTGFDPIASIFIAILIFFSVLPLIRSSFSILLLYVPPDVSDRLRQAASKTESSLGGACKVLDGKIWPNNHDSYIATVSIELSPGINPTSVSPRIETIFKEMLPSIKDLTLQFEVST